MSRRRRMKIVAFRHATDSYCLTQAACFDNNQFQAKQLVRQFDSVGVVPVALVFFRQDSFKPLCLLFSNPHVRRFWVVADEELFAATVTPECSHLLEAYRFLATTLFYCYRPHVLD